VKLIGLDDLFGQGHVVQGIARPLDQRWQDVGSMQLLRE
jgi:hypothetical protein